MGFCASGGNKTAVSLFEQALEIYGVPSRVRNDQGQENTKIWRKIIELRGEGHGSYVAAHNQRIEHLWRDVWNYVCSQFYYISSYGSWRLTELF